MARPRIVLDADQDLESQEEKPHTDAEETDKANYSQSRKVVPGEVTLSEASGSSGWRAMTNPIIMEEIANFLSDKDLVALCLTSKTTKEIVDLMDSSCWRKRAQKHEAVLRMHTQATDSTPYKEKYLLIKPEVERLANRVKGLIENNWGSIDVADHLDHLDNGYMSLQDLANTASLVYHDLLGGEVSINALNLWNGNLSSIPSEHLGSLASCVTDWVQIDIGMGASIHNLEALMEKVKSNAILIGLCGKTLGTDVILALVRAMQTRVETVFLMDDDTVVVKTLLETYDGKGRCEEVRVMVVRESIEAGEEEDMRHLAQTIDWNIDVTVNQLEPFEIETEIIFERK